MNITLERVCSEGCRDIAKKRDLETVQMLQRIEEEQKLKNEERKKKKEELAQVRRMRRADKRRKRSEKAVVLQKVVSAQSKKIRLLKQNRQRGNGFYESRQWQELRYKAIRTWGRKCMLCGAENCELHVDHIKPRSKFPDLSLSFDNLQILCRVCNFGKSNKDETDWRPTA